MTKAQERRKAKYLKQLRKCGFRSWKQANACRFVLINQKLEKGLSPSEDAELNDLQILCGLFQDYKTNDSLGRATRSLKHLATKLLKPP